LILVSYSISLAIRDCIQWSVPLISIIYLPLLDVLEYYHICMYKILKMYKYNKKCMNVWFSIKISCMLIQSQHCILLFLLGSCLCVCCACMHVNYLAAAFIIILWAALMLFRQSRNVLSCLTWITTTSNC